MTYGGAGCGSGAGFGLSVDVAESASREKYVFRVCARVLSIC